MRTTTWAGAALAGALAVAGTTVATGAGQQNPRPGPGHGERSRCSTQVEDRNLARHEAYLEALLVGDTERALSFFTPDAVVEVHGSVPFAGTWSIQDGSYAGMQMQYWEPPTGGGGEAPQVWADCDQVVLRGAFDRTSVATGTSVSTTVVEFFSFDAEGRMTRDDFYLTDTAAVLEALEP